MQSFLVQSLIASAVLTLLLNVLPRLFPSASERAEERAHDYFRESIERQQSPEPTPRVRVFFPWKAMLIGSIVLTVVVNLAGLLT